MDNEPKGFLRDFFRAVMDRPIEPDHDYYIPLYDRLPGQDPVELMARAIEWTQGESVQLLSGFRGTGKSTELRRLRRNLETSGYLVALVDIEDYVNLSTPIDVSDFLMAIMGGFSEALAEEKMLGKEVDKESYWERLAAFLTRTQVNVEELKLKGPVEIKASLKSDPTFKQRLQEVVAGHLGALVADVRDFAADAVRRLKKRHGDAREVVLLIDSMEHIRGTLTNAEAVHQSVDRLFTTHSDKLHLPHLHLILTVPPYLKVRYPNLGGLYTPGGLRILPSVKLREDEDGAEWRPGFDVVEEIVGARGDWQRLLGERQALDELIRHSGGHLRDLFRLLGEVLRRAKNLPVEGSTVQAAIDHIRNEFLPIAQQDAAWLQRVAKTHSSELRKGEELPSLAHFLDTHMLLCYHNGHEWYDVHPLIVDEVQVQAERWKAHVEEGT